jgi:nucleoside-diphosphate-sugar epimerase
MTHISILGCGWLGLPLAKDLLGNGFSVKGSTTSTDKISVLDNLGIEAFLINLTPPDSYRDFSKGEGAETAKKDVSYQNEINGDIIGFLNNSGILIIDIPPKLRGSENENFVSKIETLIPFIEKSSVKKVLFVSSTSVYADNDSVITEETLPQPDTESGKQLVQAELLLQNNSNFETTILRFGGLIGENRHPIRFLAGRKGVENPKSPINFIHQKDCIGIIQKIIETDCWNEIFNAVTPFHPTREDYYTQKAVELNLALPEFNNEKVSVGKVILSEKIERVLEYQFIKTSL